MLVIEAGMHTAEVNEIAVSQGSEFVVTVSDDKSARVWALPSRELLQVLRPAMIETPGLQYKQAQRPLSTDRYTEGPLFAVAASPDGETIAVGGSTGYKWDQATCVYLFNRVSGKLVRRLTGLPHLILDLAFSPDGSHLAVGLGNSEGVRVFRVRDGNLAWEAADLEGPVHGLSYDTGGRLAAASRGGSLRIYGPDGQKIRGREMPEIEPFEVAFTQDGSRLAMGTYSGYPSAGSKTGPRISILSGQTLDDLYRPRVDGLSGALLSVCWSRDGSSLYAAGSCKNSKGESVVRSWDRAGLGSPQDFGVCRNTIYSLGATKTGGVAFGGVDGWGVLFKSKSSLIGRPVVDHRGLQDRFMVSDDGDALQFDFLREGKVRAQFSVSDRQLTLRGSVNSPNLPGSPPKTETARFEVSDWTTRYPDWTGRSPKLNGADLKLDSNEVCLSMAIAHDDSRFVLGTYWRLRCYGPDGTERWRAVTPGAAWAVNVPANGNLVVAALGDGTIRWYRLSDGMELLAFFPHADQERWIIWTPAGYYDCSAYGWELVQWHVNRGKDREATIFAADRFSSKYYKPDVIRRVLTGDPDAIRLAVGLDPEQMVPLDPALLPPVVRIVSADLSIPKEGPTLRIRCAFKTPSGEPAIGVQFWVDGRLAKEEIGLRILTDDEVEREYTFALNEPPSRLSVLVWNRFARDESSAWQFGAKSGTLEAPSNDGPSSFPKKDLWILAVGVEKYEPASKLAPLNYAIDDAEAFIKAMQAQKGLYGNVNIYPEPLHDANLSQVKNGFDWLDRGVAEGDDVMIFLSGHGMNVRGSYFFLTKDYIRGKESSTSLAFDELFSRIRRLSPKGKVYAFIDACRSGGPTGNDATGLLSLFRNSGIITFSACRANECAQEGPQWGNGHGAFTYYLVQGLRGAKEAVKRNGLVTINSLMTYIEDRFDEDLNLVGKQKPVFDWGGRSVEASTPITRVR